MFDVSCPKNEVLPENAIVTASHPYHHKCSQRKYISIEEQQNLFLVLIHHTCEMLLDFTYIKNIQYDIRVYPSHPSRQILRSNINGQLH